MAGYAYGELAVIVTADTTRLATQVSTSSKASGEKAGKEAGSSWGKNFLSSVGTAMAVLGAEEIFKGMIEGAETAEKVQSATAAAIRSTGGAAHVTSDQVHELSESLMKKTGVETEAIQSGANMLLTFRNVRNEAGKGNDVFNQASSSLLDMTAAMTGGQVTQENMRKTAIQLGKALNDPVKGVSALSRVGVQFTAQQKEQIKTLVQSGNTLGAQKIILGELGKEFGGAAAAYATPMERLKTSTHELEVSAGMALLPTLESLATWLTNVGIPALMTFGHWIAQNKTWLVPLVTTVGTFVATLYLLSKAFEVATTAAKVFGFTLELGLGPVSLIIAGIAAVAIGLYLLWTRSALFREIVEGAFRAVAVAFDWLVAHWKIVLQIMIVATTGGLGLVAVLVWRYWSQIAGFFTRATDSITHGLANAWTLIYRQVISAWGTITAWIARMWANEVAYWRNIAGTLATVLAQAWTLIWRQAVSAWGTITSAMSGAWRNLVNLATSAGGSIASGLLSGIANGVRGIGSWINRVVVQPIISNVKHFFGIKSPSTVMAGIGGNLISGLMGGLMATSTAAIVHTVFGGMPEALGALVSKGFAAITSLPAKALSALGGVAGKIGGFFGKLFGGGGGVSAGVGKWAGLVQAVTQMLGVPQLAGVFLTQMQTESGGNPAAINLWDSNAKAGIPSQGLMQVVPPTFAAYAGPFRGRGILDPLANIYAAVAYAIARYGSSIGSVLGHGHGYAGGGIIPEQVMGIGLRSGAPYHFGERGPELVSPLSGPAPQAGRAGIVINIYPRESQSETEIAAAVNAQLHWAAAGGQA
jgi:hypothetical protein